MEWMQPAKATKPQRGYNVLPWRMVGMNYSPISEISEDDLRKFAAQFVDAANLSH
jgi:anti-sigma factor RsiW